VAGLLSNLDFLFARNIHLRCLSRSKRDDTLAGLGRAGRVERRRKDPNDPLLLESDKSRSNWRLGPDLICRSSIQIGGLFSFNKKEKKWRLDQ
jgi:hypothetical protein